MNCDDYLSMLATLPVEELAFGDARNHAAQCRDCDRVTRVVAERERNMRMSYGELYSSLATAPVTAQALMISRRRKVALFYRIGLGVLTAASLLFLVATRRLTPASSSRVSEPIQLQCLSPEQAAQLIPRSPDVSVAISPGSGGVIRVTADRSEMVRIRAFLDRYDSPVASDCAVRITVRK